MPEMKIFVQVMGTRVSDQGKQYAEFYFPGGSITVAISAELGLKIKPFIGKEIPVVFGMSPRMVVLFNRPVCLFEVHQIISVNEK